VFFVVAVTVLVADQLSKSWVRQNLALGVPWNPVSWLSPVLSLTYVTNTGAAFGLFPQFGWVYTVIALAVATSILVFYRKLGESSWLVTISLGLMLGGALGNNVVDRLWHGRVTDFIDLNFWPLQEWPVFNVADSSLVVGICIVAVLLLFSKEMQLAIEGSPAEETGETNGQ
jgi:signal peptidase II